jgi:predicted TPR repeat methyltransferase
MTDPALPQSSEGDDDLIDLSGDLTVEEAITLATRLHRLGQIEPARGIYEAVLEADPDQPHALQFLGILRFQNGDQAGGLDLLGRAISLAPDWPGPRQNLGNLLLSQGRLDEAASCYEAAAALATPSAELCSNLGVLRRHQGRFEESEASYRRALAIDPKFVDAYNNLGHLLVQFGRIDEAVQQFYTAVTLQPHSARTRRLLGLALSHLGRIVEATKVYSDWLAEEPDNPLALHYLTACTHDKPPLRASNAYVEKTFDEFAGSFDANLARLTYRAPQIIGAVVADELKPEPASLITLDAGCGTGLCAPHLRPWSNQLVGVDLSNGMLAKARERGGYDELIQAELTAFLESQSAAYDLIVSADTLCYFGDLGAVAIAAAQALRPLGWLMFTVEASAEGDGDYRLHHHGRYSHSRDYLVKVLTEGGFDTPITSVAELRMESGRPVAGHVVRAQRSASEPSR